MANGGEQEQHPESSDNPRRSVIWALLPLLPLVTSVRASFRRAPTFLDTCNGGYSPCPSACPPCQPPPCPLAACPPSTPIPPIEWASSGPILQLGALTRVKTNLSRYALQLDFIQCPFPNQIQFGLEKIHPKNASDFPNQFQFGLERKNGILQDADSKPNSDWFGKNWWPLSTSWKFQTKFSLVWKNHWLLSTPWTLNQSQFYFVKSFLERENTQTYMQLQD